MYQLSEKKENGSQQVIQTSLKIGQPGDEYEQEADAVADKVMRISESETMRMQPVEDDEETLQMQPLVEVEEILQPKSDKGSGFASPDINQQINSTKGNGKPLYPETNHFMSNAFNTNFGGVKIHTDLIAEQMNRELGARAFTHKDNIYFNKGEYNPYSVDGKRLLSHELTHVVQQKNKTNRIGLLSNPVIQKTVELRPPGRGEASAFDRAQELVDRLNAISSALEFRLDGQTLRYNVVDETLLTHFDRQLRGYIDRVEVVPMRLITGAGYVGGGPLLVDSLQLGYVDLDDFLASDDLGFQSNFIHLLAERFAVRDYNRRLGTNGVGAEWARVHPVGLNAEAEFFQNIFSDPSIRYSWDRTYPSGNYIAVFRSRDDGYRVVLRINRGRSEIRGTQISVRTADNRTLTADAFLGERAAAVP